MKARRRFFAFVLLVICSSVTSWGADGMKPSVGHTREAVHSVISGQLAAFRMDNYAAAYAFADEEIKAQFPLERFERMVKLSYPLIAHSVSAKFGLTFDDGDEALVNVRVSGAKEETVAYQFMLRRDGLAWRITGVVLLKEQTTEV